MNNKTALLIVAIYGQACGTMKNNLQTGVNTAIDRVMLAVPSSVGQSIEDAAKRIYADGRLADSTFVTVETFNVKFYSPRDSFPIQLNNFRFYRVRDSFHLQNFTFPKWDGSKYTDKMRSVTECSYQKPDGTGIGCLSGEYIVRSGKNERVAELKPCITTEK